MNEKKEVKSSRKIITNDPESNVEAVIGSATLKPVNKLTKKRLIIFAVVLFLVFCVLFGALILSNRSTKNQEALEDLNNIMATAPANNDKQYEWSIKTSEHLEKDTSYRNGDLATRTEYYNSLIGLYINQKSEQKARDLYINEIHKNNILINSNYLNWLYKNYLLINNKAAAVIVIDDLITVYGKDYGLATEQIEKLQLSQSIDELKAKKEELNK